MLVSTLLSIHTALDLTTLVNGYNEAIRMIKLRPILITVTLPSATRELDLQAMGTFTLIDPHRGNQLVKFKQITEMIAEDRHDYIPDWLGTWAAPTPTFELGWTKEVTGTVYYSNNLIATDPDVTTETVFLLIAYLLPMISGSLADDIPNHLVLLALAKAYALHAEANCDVVSAARYEYLLANLANLYNSNIVEHTPSSLTEGFTVTPSAL